MNLTSEPKTDQESSTYDFPIGMELLRRLVSDLTQYQFKLVYILMRWKLFGTYRVYTEYDTFIFWFKLNQIIILIIWVLYKFCKYCKILLCYRRHCKFVVLNILSGVIGIPACSLHKYATGWKYISTCS